MLNPSLSFAVHQVQSPAEGVTCNNTRDFCHAELCCLSITNVPKKIKRSFISRRQLPNSYAASYTLVSGWLSPTESLSPASMRTEEVNIGTSNNCQFIVGNIHQIKWLRDQLSKPWLQLANKDAECEHYDDCICQDVLALRNHYPP